MMADFPWPDGFFAWSMAISYALVLIAFVVALIRLVRGPSVPDRVVALDFLTLVGMNFVALTALETARYAYLDVAIALGLIGFLSTVALARYVLRRSQHAEKVHD